MLSYLSLWPSFLLLFFSFLPSCFISPSAVKVKQNSQGNQLNWKHKPGLLNNIAQLWLAVFSCQNPSGTTWKLCASYSPWCNLSTSLSSLQKQMQKIWPSLGICICETPYIRCHSTCMKARHIHLYLFIFKYIFTWKTESQRRDGERDLPPANLLIIGLKSQAPRATPKAGDLNSFWVSHVDAGAPST